ncbi:UNKNOWN [Stylonychia lemnae]|uniref:Uncharacterized protein n=1 Tax=Stylonychia lemnae TaxID=5949 RepID=A0A078A1G4_STYLE|nr:UNKNOWN [Stylonychia lemnae]|eukprot:CDW75682.1 UNKNOWN [Stylonychia lemnae]
MKNYFANLFSKHFILNLLKKQQQTQVRLKFLQKVSNKWLAGIGTCFGIFQNNLVALECIAKWGISIRFFSKSKLIKNQQSIAYNVSKIPRSYNVQQTS